MGMQGQLICPDCIKTPKWCQNTAEHANFCRAMHLRGPKNNYLPGMRDAAKGCCMLRGDPRGA